MRGFTSMERSKAIFISAIAIFAVSMVIFLIALFIGIGDAVVLGAVASILAIIAIVMIYIGTYIKVKENHAKEGTSGK